MSGGLSCLRRSLAPFVLAAALGAGLPTAPTRAAEPEAAAESFDATDLLRRAAASLGGGRSFVVAKLTVPGSRLSRSLEIRFQIFEDRPRRRWFLRITEPAKHAGTRYLWLAPVGWSHVPGDHLTARLTREQLLAPWMESDFALADLLRGSDAAAGAAHRVLRVDSPSAGGQGAPVVVVESLASDGAAADWPRVVTWIESGRGNPVRREYFDAEGELVRVLRYRDVREVFGRHVPHLWEMGPDGERERLSRIRIETIRFDADFEETVFTTRHLVSGE